MTHPMANRDAGATHPTRGARSISPGDGGEAPILDKVTDKCYY